MCFVHLPGMMNLQFRQRMHQLRELIKLLAVTSSQIGSRSLALVDSNGRQPAAETVAQAKQQVLVEEIRTGAKDILGKQLTLVL